MKISVDYLIPHHNNTNLQFNLNLNLRIEQGIIGVAGPSGSGKTTFLKIIAGLIKQAEYKIIWQKKEYKHTVGHLNPCVYVGADTMLFEHLNVVENLQLIEKLGVKAQHNDLTLQKVSEMCQIVPLLQQFPNALSSGEKQRVAFARALLSNKKVLLLDEAFSALDWNNRNLMHNVLKRLCQHYDYYCIMVSHSLRELGTCCTEIVAMKQASLASAVSTQTFLHSQIDLHNHQDSQDYFAVISATFSHIDFSDKNLQIWQVTNKGEKQNIVVKSKLSLNEKSTSAGAITTNFVLQASNIVLVSMGNNKVANTPSSEPLELQAQLFSMDNCLICKIANIQALDAQKLVTLEWGSLRLYAFISNKSALAMKLQVQHKIYAMFRAL